MMEWLLVVAAVPWVIMTASILWAIIATLGDMRRESKLPPEELAALRKREADNAWRSKEQLRRQRGW